MIKRDHPQLSISHQCKLVRLSRSAFYYTPVGIDADTLAVMKEIDRVFTKYPFFGSRRIAAYLRREGVVVGRHRVRRLMAGGNLQMPQNQPAASAASGLPILAEKDGDRPPQPGLVRRYHLRAGAERVLVSGRDHGLGLAQGPELAAVEHDACGLLRRCAE